MIGRRPLALTLAAMCIGCAAGSPGAGRGGADVLTHEALLATDQTDLFRAVERLRPQWLVARSQTSIIESTVVALFVDGSPRGDVGGLTRIPILDVRDVSYLSPSEAAFRFGTLAGLGGAVVVRTGR